ncbi:MAG: D-alanine--D-alanine ligase [Deltaproteobacteria bacterium]|nr:D-alanine--D-alanine ligase [Deltaproteobacteria bacterium]
MSDLKSKKIAVIFGGLSSERDVSIHSGQAFLKALKEMGYAAVGVELGHRMVQQLLEMKADLIVNGLHGKIGEDGCIQGALECLGIPYTGSGVLASAIAMNKIMTKKLVRSQNIQTPDFIEFDVSQNVVDDVQKKIQFPCVVKAQAEGSTMGTSIVRTEKEFSKAATYAGQFDDRIFVEKFIDGIELTVPVVNGKAHEIIEIVPKSGFYDFASKYTKGATDYILPARISKDVHRMAQEIASQVYRHLGCRGCARVDFMLDAKNRPWFIEINTLPGMTETSLVPKSLAYEGVSFHDLVEMILKGARLDHEKLYRQQQIQQQKK